MRINGARIHYEREGDAPPIVLLHAGVADSRIPNVSNEIINDAAHLPNLEHPDEFNRLVLDFLLES